MTDERAADQVEEQRRRHGEELASIVYGPNSGAVR